MTDRSDLAWTVVVVTGAGQGLGRAEALELARQGASVVIGELDASAAEETAEAIRGAGGQAAVEIGDCAEVEMADRLVDAATTRFGRLDALVNNAGLLRDRTLAKMSDEEWDVVIRVNLRSHFVMTRRAFVHWRAAARPGRVVCTSSTSGLLGGFGQTNYGAAKAGVAAFAGIAAQEGWRDGITVNAICPAARTRLSEGAFGAIRAREDFDFWHPDNVAPFVAFLCSEAAAHISGKVFGVQGDAVEIYRPWTSVGVVINDGARWRPEQFGTAVERLLEQGDMNAGPEDAMRLLALFDARLRLTQRRAVRRPFTCSPSSTSFASPAPTSSADSGPFGWYQSRVELSMPMMLLAMTLGGRSLASSPSSSACATIEPKTAK